MSLKKNLNWLLRSHQKQKVIEFQKTHHLPTTGKIGIKTLTTITKYYIPDFCENPTENAHAY